MDTKIQLIHPAGKKAVSIDIEKYNLIKKAILNYLETSKTATHSEILNVITREFEMNNTNFQGSIAWYMEWVKLDLEARKIIKKSSDNKPSRYSL